MRSTSNYGYETRTDEGQRLETGGQEGNERGAAIIIEEFCVKYDQGQDDSKDAANTVRYTREAISSEHDSSDAQAIESEDGREYDS